MDKRKQTSGERKFRISATLVVALIVCLGLLLFFLALAREIVSQQKLASIDVNVLSALRKNSTAAGDQIAVVVSLVGSPISMSILAVAGAAWLIRGKRWATLATWVIAFAGATALAEGFKRAIARPRPTGAEAFLHGASFSFPSAHTVGATVGFGMLAYLIYVGGKPSRAKGSMLAFAAAFMAIAVGISRLYLGVHYATDVAGGLAIGGSWLMACIIAGEWARARVKREDRLAETGIHR